MDNLKKNTQISNFMKIHPMGAELFLAERWTDGRTDMTELIVASFNFVNAPEKTLGHVKHVTPYKA
jgi:ubiquinone biosynthesis protein Coq4